MSNDEPPRACLADFGFMTMVFDPNHPMTCSTQLEGGTLRFMSSELLMPTKFGLKNSVPTPQSDVYAFGLVIFQVCKNHCQCQLCIYFVQVLTGEIPFRNLGPTGHIIPVIEGGHPDKPNNAPSIGFSDKLWAFAKRCWNVDMKLRPSTAEVVECLCKAKVDWHGVMPPCSNTVDPATPPEDTLAELKMCGEFEAQTVLRCLRASNFAGRIFDQPSNAAPETATDSRVTSPLSLLSSPSTLCTEPPPQPQAATPEIKPWVPRGPTEEPRYPHLDQKYKSPPSFLPRKKWTSFTSLKQSFRRFFGLPPRS